MWIRMGMYLFLFLCLGFWIQVADAGNVTVCRNEEEYQECGSCEGTCDNPKNNAACRLPCYPGCFCKAGLLRARDRSCVEPKDCNRSSCKENEEYLDCGSQCFLTCDNYQESIFCTKPCKQGCFCKPGYVVGPNTKCILPAECPIGPCSSNEMSSDCVNSCNTCTQRGNCYTEFCNRGCDCKPGYFRNITGQCVEEKNCDVQESKCPQNEHHVSCVSLCSDCWNRGECDQVFCQPGCDCVSGYFRNDHGDCIPERQCNTEDGYCGVNEEYSDCAVPCNDCNSRGNCHYTCEYGCDCKRGYYRNEKSVCIPADQCSEGVIEQRCQNCAKCPVGERYYACQPRCKTTCETYHRNDSDCSTECRPGCFCKEGLVRNREGACVYPRQCPQVCGENEDFEECGSSCPSTCHNRKPKCAQQCIRGCFCKSGFIRGPGGRCVRNCPLVCGVNEEFLECGSPCPLTCANLTAPELCPKVCVQGCVCKPGFVRGPTGSCVYPSECPPVCQENEVFLECGSSCQGTCENVGKVSESCLLPCRRGCFCKPPYVRGPQGKCILLQQCPVVCQENEVFLECGSSCQRTCENVGKVSESCLLPCRRGCFCKPPYVSGPQGKCILPQQCPVVCQENEVFLECGSSCQETCENVGNVSESCLLPCRRGCFCKPPYVRGPELKCILPQQCPVVCKENEVFLECGSTCRGTCENAGKVSESCFLPCRKGCFCKPPYVRGPQGKCILPQLCPLVCQENEVFLECGSSCQETCENVGNVSESCLLPCRRGCFCKPPYVRGPEGKCILPQQCPVVCKENEVFLECGSTCRGTCENAGKVSESCFLPCRKGCFCKPPYVRGPQGKCILPQLCPLVCQENEVFLECGSSCQETCENVGNVSESCSLLCRRGCFCKPPYVRGPVGKCILPQQCPVVCKENEVFLECGSSCQGTCENVGKVSESCFLPCRKGCFCKPPYVRGPQGKCILPQLCPVVCQENEVFLECGSSCQETCENVGNVSESCSLLCRRGCFCKPPYVRGPVGKCILPQQCPVVCKENEVFLECGSSCQGTCENVGKVSESCFLPCRKGCFCKPPYVRGPQGKCILPQLCPVVCQENEMFLECGSSCQGTCENVDNVSESCLLPCRRGCFCKPPYVRGPQGKCILPQQCPVVCQENEVFLECGSSCQGTCENVGNVSESCLLPCRRGCFCKPPYVRGPEGKCILQQLCPVVCQENEVFLECGSSCQGTCENVGKVSKSCLLSCRRGCFCKAPYIRGPQGKCILPQQCPLVCQENEVFQECGSPCQDTCENIGKAVSAICPLTCIKGCFCKPGYVRGPNGQCILPNHCPLVCPDNEVLLSCGSPCQQTCDNLNSVLTPCVLPCIKGCFCKPGYVRGPNRLCILPTECPVVCGKNEEFKKCGQPCPATCQNLTPSCGFSCKEGCFCKPGLVRGPDGNCIPPSRCPIICGENEEFQPCGSVCPATCQNPIISACPLPCKEGCFCKPGFVRGPDGKCILPTACPVVCGKNEEFQPCGSVCPATCQNPTISACPLPCKEGCFCKPGFVRGPDGICILLTACPVVCKENEIFQKCGPACPVTCSNRIPTVGCFLPCIEGCFCKPGFVKGPNGKCILPTHCPVVCGENEQFYECKSPCQPTCENQALNCPKLPCLTGCFCQPGFVRNANGKCVHPRSCPKGPCTKENEIYDSCGPACIRTCARVEFRRQCPQQCVKGCFCKEGFVRDIDSNCIQPQDCPKEAQMCPNNESFYACKPTCRDTCETLEFQGPCHDLCRPGCACRGGLVRNRFNKCVPPRNCPGKIMGRKRENEDETTTTTTLIPDISISVPENKKPPTTLIEMTETTSQIIPEVTRVRELTDTTSGTIPKATTAGVNNDETISTPNFVPSTQEKSSTESPITKQPVTTVQVKVTSSVTATATTDKSKEPLTNSKTFTHSSVFGNTVASTTNGIQQEISTRIKQEETTSILTQTTPPVPK